VPRVETQPFAAGSMTVRNVRAFVGPATAERIVIGAHYDAAGPYPGADDNASGVAGLLELARLLDGDALPMKVELVSYPLEEPPFFGTDRMGSAVHAASLRDEGADVRAMLALEMIGYFSDAPRSQRFPLSLMRPFYPSTGDFILVASSLFRRALVRRIRAGMRAASPLPVESINAPALLPGISLSDHRNYWSAGYDAAMITDTAFYRNPHYHGPGDTPDTLDYARMAEVVHGVRGAIRALAE
jgi:Zn-dependent M28 family amino/carboxypeptidase